MECPWCQHENPADMNFCGSGAPRGRVSRLRSVMAVGSIRSPIRSSFGVASGSWRPD
jgi:hypothetical protein